MDVSILRSLVRSNNGRDILQGILRTMGRTWETVAFMDARSVVLAEAACPAVRCVALHIIDMESFKAAWSDF
jgi:hypothetical protein